MNTLDLIAAIIRSAQFTITGRLAYDPEPKYFDSGKCKLKLKILVNRIGAKRNDPNAPKPDPFIAELWNEDAQQAADELRKGDLLKVTGRLYTDTWTKRDSGEQITDVVIKVEEWCPVAGNPAPAPAQLPASGEEIPF